MMYFQHELLVELIATPKRVFKTRRTDEGLVDMAKRYGKSFRYFPVVDLCVNARETITGLIELVPFMQAGPLKAWRRIEYAAFRRDPDRWNRKHSCFRDGG